jgi:hypothetical protein
MRDGMAALPIERVTRRFGAVTAVRFTTPGPEAIRVGGVTPSTPASVVPLERTAPARSSHRVAYAAQVALG